MSGASRGAGMTDVLIIGAGASGSVAARHLAQNGFKVVCLEQGPQVDNGEFYGDKPEWELMAQKRWHPTPTCATWRTTIRCDDVGIRRQSADVQRCRRQHDPVLRRTGSASCRRISGSKTLDGVADDWPFTYEDLEPFYDQMDHRHGRLRAGRRSRPIPPGKAPPLPPLPIGKIGLKARPRA